MSTDIAEYIKRYPAWIREGYDRSANQVLSEGVGASLAQITYRGKVWRVVEKGIESVIQDDRGNPTPVLKCVILQANGNFNRRFWEGAWKEGDSNPPDCWSIDNIKPDATVQHKQNPICDTCPNNAWGSRQTENGSRGKACAEYRRLAVIPDWLLGEADPQVYLLSVPPGSLKALKEYNDILDKLHLNFWHLVTQIGFDVNQVFQLNFKPTTLLPDVNAPKIRQLQGSKVISQILSIEESDLRIPGQQAVSGPAQAAATPQPAQTPAPQAPAPQQAPTQGQQAPTPTPPAPEPQPAPAAAQQAPAQAQTQTPKPKPVRKQGAPVGPAANPAAGVTKPAAPAAEAGNLGLQLGALVSGLNIPSDTPPVSNVTAPNGHGGSTIEGSLAAAEVEQGEEESGTGDDQDLAGLVSRVLASEG